MTVSVALLPPLQMLRLVLSSSSASPSIPALIKNCRTNGQLSLSDKLAHMHAHTHTTLLSQLSHATRPPICARQILLMHTRSLLSCACAASSSHLLTLVLAETTTSPCVSHPLFHLLSSQAVVALSPLHHSCISTPLHTQRLVQNACSTSSCASLAAFACLPRTPFPPTLLPSHLFHLCLNLFCSSTWSAYDSMMADGAAAAAFASASLVIGFILFEGTPGGQATCECVSRSQVLYK